MVKGWGRAAHDQSKRSVMDKKGEGDRWED